ncbi:transcriptional regulator [Brucella endophytica]|uniref:Transcriptional regulator n=1 Tax=Brucella endophytica TaxID=1963359 RepID=A0A916WC09_9HYPH|nr:TetR/AcrR family transcriptional regulator [Brucella endophytica]GGA87222.1 transcriptional regulator [Brucella endophytica]
MSSTKQDETSPRQRLTRDERYRQLITVAWTVVQQEGTEALTLGHLAVKAGVTKPVVYDHFQDRNGLLAALYREFDARQNALIDAAIAGSAQTAPVRAQVLANAYVDCVLAQGREIPGIIAALSGSPELERVKREGESAFLAKCRAALEPASPSGHVSLPGLRAMLGAAEALASAAAANEMSAEEAKRELRDTILDMLTRQKRT